MLCLLFGHFLPDLGPGHSSGDGRDRKPGLCASREREVRSVALGTDSQKRAGMGLAWEGRPGRWSGLVKPIGQARPENIEK